MSSVIVIATLIARPGQEEALAGVLRGLLAPSRQDHGCIQYDLHRDSADPAVFIFYEQWASREALDDHLATPHLAALLQQKDQLTQAMEVRIVEKQS